MAPGGLHAACDADEVLALDGARAGDDLELVAADLDAVAAVDDGVLGVELAICALERLGDALHALDDIHGLEQERVDLGRVAHQADDGLVLCRARTSVLSPFFSIQLTMWLTASSLALCFKIAIMVCLLPRWIALAKRPALRAVLYGA